MTDSRMPMEKGMIPSPNVLKKIRIEVIHKRQRTEVEILFSVTPLDQGKSKGLFPILFLQFS